jgi:mannose-6-phosphate isomerase-like protein (cupin superfamily)
MQDLITLSNTIKQTLKKQNIRVQSVDLNRPWGGFLVIEENDAQPFIDTYFSDIDAQVITGEKVSPKILFVAPDKKLSWQYHHRRAEIWKLIEGEAGLVRSMNDLPGKTEFMKRGEVVTLQKGERHRLVGTNQWGVVAEIWIHTDPQNPSNEDDIIRLQDDFGR